MAHWFEVTTAVAMHPRFINLNAVAVIRHSDDGQAALHMIGTDDVWYLTVEDTARLTAELRRTVDDR